METIFYLEDRGGWLYHIIVYNIGGLYYIFNEEYNKRGRDISCRYKDHSKIVDKPSQKIKYPIKILINNLKKIHFEIFEILKDKIELVTDGDLKKYKKYEIISIYGETCDTNPFSDNYKIIYPFLRNLFLKNTQYNFEKKRIFITRYGSEKNHNNIKRRIIINENEFMKMLEKYNFERIKLDEISMVDKIKLFNTSEYIISSHGSNLTCSLWSNKKSKIIEILNKGTSGFNPNHIKKITNTLNIKYFRYSNIIEDKNGNFKININEFENYLNTIIN